MKISVKAFFALALCLCILFSFCSCGTFSIFGVGSTDESANIPSPKLNFYIAAKNLEAAGYNVSVENRTPGVVKELAAIEYTDGCDASVVFRLIKFRNRRLAELYYNLEMLQDESSDAEVAYNGQINKHVFENYREELSDVQTDSLSYEIENWEDWIANGGDRRICGRKGKYVWIGSPETVKYTYSKGSLGYERNRAGEEKIDFASEIEPFISEKLSLAPSGDAPNFDFPVASANLKSHGYYAKYGKSTSPGEISKLTVTSDKEGNVDILTVVECKDPELAQMYYEKQLISLECKKESARLQRDILKHLRIINLGLGWMNITDSIDYYEDQLRELENQTVGKDGAFVWYGSKDAVSSTLSEKSN